MKKRWIVNLILLAVVAGLGAFLYLRPKADAEQSTMHDLSSYKLAEFNAIRVEFPTQAPLALAKVDGYWRITAPINMRADQASVQRILSIIAAQSSDKISGGDMAKFGLTNPELKLKLVRKEGDLEEFIFGNHNPVTEDQYVAHRNHVYLVSGGYSEAAATQMIELIDKAPLKPTEKVVGFEFGRLEQWEDANLKVDIVDGKWKVSIATAKPQQNELNEWLDFSWVHNPAKSVEMYTPDRKLTYPSFEIKMADGSKVHFDKIQESPDLLLARPDEGLIYHFPSDIGFSMLNPPLNIPNK